MTKLRQSVYATVREPSPSTFRQRVGCYMLRWATVAANPKLINELCTPKRTSLPLLKAFGDSAHLKATMQISSEATYQENKYKRAISTLNTLQSNSSVLMESVQRKHNNDSKHIADTWKYLKRIGISPNDVAKLPAIHVSGTKGKGSTCAAIESILRHNGYRTGFFSSPHLVSVTERIRIDGVPISSEKFTKFFWKIYNQLASTRDHGQDLPSYFTFLTILAIDVFLREELDVCIIEVGIGGRYDCTNVLQNTSIVGITSLGLEHTKLLGSTLEEIAWQKAGIIKPGSDVFTVEQPASCINIIEKECREQQASPLRIVPAQLNAYDWTEKPSVTGKISSVAELNISLAIQIACAWILKTRRAVFPTLDLMVLPKAFTDGIERCYWPGRLQRIHCNGLTTLFLDGAHTVESIAVCARWFNSQSVSNRKRLLVFNTTGDRDSHALLSVIVNASAFDAAFFVPNVAVSASPRADAVNYNSPTAQQFQQCKQNEVFWKINSNGKAFVHESVGSVFNQIENEYHAVGIPCDILITGSIHLIGATMTALNLEKYASTANPEESV